MTVERVRAYLRRGSQPVRAYVRNDPRWLTKYMNEEELYDRFYPKRHKMSSGVREHAMRVE